MKIQTLTLPTGEFVFVISGDMSRFARPRNLEAYETFRNAIGAAAVLYIDTSEDVEIEQPLELNAHRRNEGVDLVDAIEHWQPEGVDAPREQTTVSLDPDPRPLGVGDRVTLEGLSFLHRDVDGLTGGVLQNPSPSYPSEGLITVALDQALSDGTHTVLVKRERVHRIASGKVE